MDRASNDAGHPIITYYKDTLKSNIPLILFVGREPNGELGEYAINRCGQYDFDDYKNSNEWNNTFYLYGRLAQIANKNIIIKMKEIMRAQKCSPVLFANISGASIPNDEPYSLKHKIRIKESQKEDHILNMMGQKIITKEKVQLVISNDNLVEFKQTRDLLKDICDKKGIPFISISQYLGRQAWPVKDKDNLVNYLKKTKPYLSEKTVAEIFRENYLQAFE